MSQALDEEQDQPVAGRASPRIAVVGCGAWGQNHVRTLARLGVLAGVQDLDDDLAKATAERYDVKFLSFDEIARGGEVDAAVIATPAAHHARLALELLTNAKHVLVEKPLALNIADAEALCSIARSANRVLMVGHLLQYHAAFRALLAAVQAGRLGRLQYIHSNRLNLGRFRREEDALWSFAPHDISMILSLAGEEPSDVHAVGSAILSSSAADVTTTHLRFPSGLRAHVLVSWLHPVKEQRLVVVGDRGMAVFDDNEPWTEKLLIYPHQIEWRDGQPRPSKGEPEPVDLGPPSEPLELECEHFVSCCRGEQAPLTDGAEALAVLRVLQDAADSLSDPDTWLPDTRLSPSRDSSIHPSTVLDEPCTIGAGTRVWHFGHVSAGSVIGRGCVLGQNVYVGPNVRIGDRCKIQNNVSLYEGVILEDEVFCGPSAVFTNVVNPRAAVDRRDELRPTVVARGATIGANATIVCGHTIGAHALVGAGSVVTTDVPPYGLVAGVPARRIGWVSTAGERLDDQLTCPRTGERFRLTGPNSIEPITTEQTAVPLIDLAAQRRRIGASIDAAVRTVLEHGRYVGGPEVHELEQALSTRCGGAEVIGVGNGTDALVLALHALEIGPGDAVVVPSFTFTATAEAVALVHATPVFADCDESTYLLDVTSTERALQEATARGLVPRAIVPVDLFGQPVDYARFGALADAWKVVLIADGAQSFGATWDGQPVGSLATITTTSFFPSKPLGCYGDGGAVITADRSLAAAVRSLRSHGQGSSKYQNERIGANSRLDTIQAAVLLAKLGIFDDEIARRQEVADGYRDLLASARNVVLPQIQAGATSTWAQFTFRSPRRDDVARALADERIASAIYYPTPLHLLPPYRDYPRAGALPVSEAIVREVLAVPMHPYLDFATQSRVARTIHEAAAR